MSAFLAGLFSFAMAFFSIGVAVFVIMKLIQVCESLGSIDRTLQQMNEEQRRRNSGEPGN
jgi:hypothetical protein